jgi:predicted ATP-grasp superfamily ATP-dependent carboligase
MLVESAARGTTPRAQPLPPAIVLGGSANAVSVARSLAAAGVHVTALGHAGSPVRHSRACARFVDLGRGDGVQGRWLRWLAGGPAGAVLLPCDDDALELLVTHRPTLLHLGLRVFEAADTVALDMLDKDRTYEIARAIGVDAPRTVTVHSAAGLASIAGDLVYPCALKPVHSHRFQRRSGTGVKAFVVHDATQLRERYAYTSELGVEMLVTEIIPGPDSGIVGYHAYLDEEGAPLLELTKRKLRQHPVGFGLGCLHETTDDPEVRALGLAFLRGAGVRGLANVEFKRDERDGRLKLIECNHRFTAPNEQFRRAGMDLALFAYSRLAGRPAPAVDTYRTGVRLWHPGKDLRSFLELRRRGELTTAAWLRSVARPQHFPLLSWDDPAPAVAAQVQRAGRILRRRLPGGRRGRTDAVAGAAETAPAAAPARIDVARPAAAGAHGR